MNTYLIILCVLSEAVSVNVVARGDTRVDFNADASYTCTHADPTGVLQVTWQRLFKDDSVENLATYSKRFGAQIIDPHRGKVVFTEASLNSTSITVKNVTWSDDACYICSFNVYPSGSIRKQTCLTVQGVSEVRATMQKVPSTEPDSDMEVVVSCSATGKPAPWIQWNISAAALIKTPNNWTVINKDQTVTANSNIILQLLPGSGGYVDCIVNNGMRTQRHERVLLPILPGEREVEEGLSQLVRTQQVVTATLGEDAVLTCELMTPKDVREVTWQKVTTEMNENVATYSKRGPDVNVRFKGKVEFEDEGLQNCSIVIRGVSRGDESCYRCLFNAYPEGAISGRTCLQVNELYGPSLLITQTNNSHTTLSCSATGRPAPIVTWEDTEILENSTMANVTHLNGTVTVTITSTLAAFSLPDKDTRVGCVVSLFSGGVTKNVSMVIPARTQASFPGLPEVTDGDRISVKPTGIGAVMGSLCFIAVCCGAAVALCCKQRNTTRRNY